MEWCTVYTVLSLIIQEKYVLIKCISLEWAFPIFRLAFQSAKQACCCVLIII